MTDLLALAKRVEEGEGGDDPRGAARELEGEICVALGLGFEVEWTLSQHTMEPYPVLLRRSTDHAGGVAREAVRPLTSSLDAVVEMAEERLPGWGWEVHRDDDHFKGPLFYWGAVRELTMVPVSYRTRAKSPARALLAALLRALAAKGDA